MADWKSLAEQVLPREDAEAGEALTFGEPATAEALAEVEAQLKIKLPRDLREFLKTFDGVMTPTGEWVIFSCEEIIINNEETREAYADWELEIPVDDVLMISGLYGTGDLFGICLRRVGKFQAGQVVFFDHETGELTDEAKECGRDLAAFLANCRADDA